MSEDVIQIRVMDDKGRVSIPVEIQDKMHLKASELPKFEIKVETEPKMHISLYPLNYVSDSSKYINT